ncbi:uncharacterized protein [Euphorbia lathyris]|uniref:uncharacterized protein isoform X1 n=1 Tax=Euphorbia lathyris TaxID=212925 RepID=UPI0033139A3C
MLLLRVRRLTAACLSSSLFSNAEASNKGISSHMFFSPSSCFTKLSSFTSGTFAIKGNSEKLSPAVTPALPSKLLFTISTSTLLATSTLPDFTSIIICRQRQ